MIRFFNGRTLTMAHGVTVTTDEVWTDGDKIAYVGSTPGDAARVRAGDRSRRRPGHARASKTHTRTPG